MYFPYRCLASLNIQLLPFTWRLIISRKAIKVETNDFSKKSYWDIGIIKLYVKTGMHNSKYLWIKETYLYGTDHWCPQNTLFSPLFEQDRNGLEMVSVLWFSFLTTPLMYSTAHSTSWSIEQLPDKADFCLFLLCQWQRFCKYPFKIPLLNKLSILKVFFCCSRSKSLRREVGRTPRTVSPFIHS